MSDFTITPKNRVKRMPTRGQYERETVYQIVDAALICHVGFVQDGQPFVIPTLHARRDDEILLHGASTSRMMQHICDGHEVCLSMTLVDGLVLAKSVFHHSINYRSVVIFGRGRLIETDAEKMAALDIFTERIMPGRWQDARKPNAIELKATSVVAIPITEASAKIRTGPPKDDPEDVDLPIWTGVLPLQQIALAPVRAEYSNADIPIPEYMRGFMARLKASDTHSMQENLP